MTQYDKIFNRYCNIIQQAAPLSPEPLVSILMAYYNKQKYIEDSIISIKNQTYKNWELIIINDASPDNPEHIIKKFSDDPRIHYHMLNKNTGSAAARNHAFQLSKGEYILVFDADDIMHPTMLQHYVNRIQAPDAPDIVMANIIHFGDSIQERYIEYTIRDEYTLTKENWILSQSLVRRFLWEATGGMPTSEVMRNGAEDWELWLHMFELYPATSVVLLEFPLMLYRQTGNSLSRQTNLFAYKVYEEICKQRKKIFFRNNTQKYMLCSGYQLSIITYVKQGKYFSAFKIFLDGPRLALLLIFTKKIIKKTKKIYTRCINFFISFYII